MIDWVKQKLGRSKSPVVRRCRLCGTAVPAGEGMCPRCHGMDIDEGPLNERQQKEEASRGG